MQVDNASHSSQILGLQRRSSCRPDRKGRWATNGLNSVIAENLERLAADERILIRRLLDHIQTVDEIFSHNLEAHPHGHHAPRSDELPSFDALASKARSMADWYADYADALRPEEVDEVIAFSFSNGDPHA
jgi:hypothetical protein